MLKHRVSSSLLAAAALFIGATHTRQAYAQIVCNASGPDLVIGEIGGGSGLANFNLSGGVDAVSFGDTLCNVGDSVLFVQATTPRHPVITTNVYRLVRVDGSNRFEQIGMGWVFHTIFALSGNFCCTTCTPTDGSRLGVGCSSSDSAAIMGSPSSLGPRSEIDPSTGSFPFPAANPPISHNNARRTQLMLGDVDPTLNPGAVYFAELIGVTSDEVASNSRHNNVSFRPITFANSSPIAGVNVGYAGASSISQPALSAWRAAESGVIISIVDVPGDGRLMVAAQATSLGGGVWHYEYAAFNLSSHRSGQRFSVPLRADTIVENLGFHDVSYHDGDGGGNVNFDGTDWPTTVSPSTDVSWETTTFVANPNANALRWGTMYNFRFDAAVPPSVGSVTLTLFRPGTPESVAFSGLPVPGGIPLCPADVNSDGFLNSQDLFDFLASFFALLPAADFNDDGFVNSQDFFDYLAAFFAGC